MQARLDGLAGSLVARVLGQGIALTTRIEAHGVALSARMDTLTARVDAQGVALMAGLDAINGALDSGFGGRYRELVLLAKRRHLSPAEEVLAIPFLSKRSVMSFLTQCEARPLRLGSRACHDAVAEHAWGAEPYSCPLLTAVGVGYLRVRGATVTGIDD